MFEVGGIFARAGLKVDDDGFREFERRYDSAHDKARRPVEAEGRMDADRRGFDQYNRHIDDSQRRTGRFRTFARTSFHGIGVAAAGGAAVAGAGLAVLGKQAIDTASDINESLTKNQVIFGDHAKAIERESRNSARAMGISRAAFLEYTGTFGNLFKSMGIAREENAKMSSSLTGLAADMASFNNASPEEALEALRSGLTGEAEPLRRFGVLLSEARVQQEAYNTGIADQGAELTEAEKAQARYQLVFKDTAAAQGDFERTSGGLANQTRILKAQFADASGELGARLLPIVLKVVSAFNDLLAGNGKVSRAFAVVTDSVRNAAKWIGDAIAGIRRVFSGGNRDATTYGHNVASVFRAIIAFGRSLFRSLASIFDGIGGDLAIIGRAWLRMQAVISGVVLAVAKRVLPALKQAIEGLALIVRGVVRIIAGILSGDWQRVWDGAKDLVVGVMKLIVGAVRTATAPIREGFARIGRAVKDFLIDRFNDARRVVLTALDRILGGLTTAMGAMSSMLRVGSKIPGLGSKFDDLADDIDRSRDRMDRFRDSLIRTPSEKKVTVTLDLRPPSGIVSGGDGWGIENAIDATMRQGIASGAIDPFPPGVMGSGAGAFHHFDPIASSFGLSLTSGFRPGSITSSGNRSYHSMNRAGDYSNGYATPQELAFATFVAGWFGSDLKELIHTPLGFSIKNGARVAPYAAKDHYDHVHIALNRGGFLPGTREGDRIPALLEEGEGVLNREAVKGLGGPAFVDWANTKWRRFQVGGVASRKPIAYKNIGMGETFLAKAAHKVDELERVYTREDRKFNRSTEEFIGEDAEGKPVLDQKAVDRRKKELLRLMHLRDSIRGWLREQLIATRRLIATLNKVIKGLRRTLKGLKGKKNAGRRDRIRARIGNLEGRLSELDGQPFELEQAILDSKVDSGDLQWEFDNIPSAAPSAPAPPSDGGGDLDGGQAAPTQEDIARAAAAQLAAFQEARSALFGSFGSNFAATGTNPFATEQGQAAGMRFFGAASEGSGGGTTVNQTFNFGGGPEDELTFSQRVAGEMKAAVG